MVNDCNRTETRNKRIRKFVEILLGGARTIIQQKDGNATAQRRERQR